MRQRVPCQSSPPLRIAREWPVNDRAFGSGSAGQMQRRAEPGEPGADDRHMERQIV